MHLKRPIPVIQKVKCIIVWHLRAKSSAGAPGRRFAELLQVLAILCRIERVMNMLSDIYT